VHGSESETDRKREKEREGERATLREGGGVVQGGWRSISKFAWSFLLFAAKQLNYTTRCK